MQTAKEPPATMATQAIPVTTVGNILPSRQEMLKDHEYRKARLAQLRLSLPQSYPGLIELLGLLPDEADRLWSLLAEDQLQASANEIPLVNGQIDSQAMREMSVARAQYRRELDDSLTALLGDSRFQQWKDYQETRPSHQQAAQLNRTMESMGLLLNDAQMRPLTAALVAEQKRQGEDIAAQFTSSGAARSGLAQPQEENFRREEESNRRIIDAAAPHLSERQLETLRAILDQQLTMKQASSRVRRELAKPQAQQYQEQQR
jgi:hypothetical protein